MTMRSALRDSMAWSRHPIVADPTPCQGPRPRPGADLRGAGLAGLSLLGEDLQGADLRDADLRSADLRGVDLFDARLDGADLRGTRLDMSRIVEIRIPEDLDERIVNQIRHFDFRHAMTRFVGPNRVSENLPCPYRHATMRPVLFEWGSRTWRHGRNWAPPANSWTLEEIIAAVLDALGCRHGLARPMRSSS